MNSSMAAPFSLDAADEIQIGKAEVNNHENHHLPEKMRIIDRSPGGKLNGYVTETSTLSKTLFILSILILTSMDAFPDFFY